MTKPLRLGVLISGGGTTMANLHEYIQRGDLNAEIVCVVSSKAKAVGVSKSKGFGYATYVKRRTRFASDEAYSAAIEETLVTHEVDLIVLAGFLRRFLPSTVYRESCINIHPSLLPAFGGKGFYGHYVHEAVWRTSCKVSGCTVHLVTPDYDDGPIIVQRAVEIDHEDQPDDIARKVFAAECEALPLAISYFAEGRIRFESGRSILN